MPHATLEETEEEVRIRRGTPQDTLARIRERYRLAESVTDERIFFLACHWYYSGSVLEACAKKDYVRFEKEGIMPEYVYRCGDPDVFYPKMMPPI